MVDLVQNIRLKLFGESILACELMHNTFGILVFKENELLSLVLGEVNVHNQDGVILLVRVLNHVAWASSSHIPCYSRAATWCWDWSLLTDWRSCRECMSLCKLLRSVALVGLWIESQFLLLPFILNVSWVSILLACIVTPFLETPFCWAFGHFQGVPIKLWLVGISHILSLLLGFSRLPHESFLLLLEPTLAVQQLRSVLRSRQGPPLSAIKTSSASSEVRFKRWLNFLLNSLLICISFSTVNLVLSNDAQVLKFLVDIRSLRVVQRKGWQTHKTHDSEKLV